MARSKVRANRAQLAEAMGVHHGMIHKWELPDDDPSSRSPRMDNLLRLVDVLGCNPEWMVNGTGVPYSNSQLAIAQRLRAAISTRLEGPQQEDSLRQWTSGTPWEKRVWAWVGPRTVKDALALEAALQESGFGRHEISEIIGVDEETKKYVEEDKGDRDRILGTNILQWRVIHEAMTSTAPQPTPRVRTTWGGPAPILFAPEVVPHRDSFLMHRVEDDSTSATFPPGTLVLADQDLSTGDGWFLLEVNEAPIVRRVRRLPGQRILAADEAGGEIQMTPDEDCRILGRVIWMGRKTWQGFGTD